MSPVTGRSILSQLQQLVEGETFLMTVQLYEFGKNRPQIQDSKASGYYYGQKTRTKYVGRHVDEALLLDIDI